MKRNLLMAVAVIALGTTLGACSARGAYLVGYGPPPPPRHGIVGVAPAPGYVWTDGYWDRRGGGWFWVGGRWARPPYPRSVWVPGYWEHGRDGHRFHCGYWRRGR